MFHDLKLMTSDRCRNCGGSGHWGNECERPKPNPAAAEAAPDGGKGGKAKGKGKGKDGGKDGAAKGKGKGKDGKPAKPKVSAVAAEEPAPEPTKSAPAVHQKGIKIDEPVLSRETSAVPAPYGRAGKDVYPKVQARHQADARGSRSETG